MNNWQKLAMIIFIFTSCNDTMKKSDVQKDLNAMSIEKKDSLLRKCITNEDSVFNRLNAVSYIVLDSFYTVKVRVGGLDTILPYQFDCSVPGNLVPFIHSYHDNRICLITGAGQHYRLFKVFYPGDSGVIIKKYETALATDLKNDLVVYYNDDTLPTIYAEKIRTGSKTSFTLPSTFSFVSIAEVVAFNQKVTVKFSDGRKINFPSPG